MRLVQDQEVVGSNPTRSTTLPRGQMASHHTFNVIIAGSIPVGVTPNYLSIYSDNVLMIVAACRPVWPGA